MAYGRNNPYNPTYAFAFAFILTLAVTYNGHYIGYYHVSYPTCHGYSTVVTYVYTWSSLLLKGGHY